MRKLPLIISMLMVAALLLAACSPAQETESPVFPETGTGLPGGTEEVLPSAGPQDGTPTASLTESPLGSPTAGFNETPAATVEPTLIAATPTSAPTSQPETGATPQATGTGAPSTGGAPSSQGAEILPETGREQLTLLTNLLSMTVQDRNGAVLGMASDYVLNLCEAHILYIVLDADPALGLTGDQALIPYEIVTLHSGTLNADENTITLNVDASQLAGAPGFQAGSLDLTGTDWEAEVQGFWTDVGNLSLTTECRVPASEAAGQPEGTPAAGTTPTAAEGGQTPERVSLNKIALAQDVLQAQIQDGNGQPLGTVEEVIVEPESGRLRFIAARLNEDLGAGTDLALIPLGALNLQDSNEAGTTGETVLVLLVETSVLVSAPQVSALPDPANTGWDAQATEYWSQYVPMTRDQLP